MSLESKRRTRRKRYAIAGSVVFGAGIPAASYGLPFALPNAIRSDAFMYCGLSVAFAAYVLHVFLLDRRVHTRPQWLAVMVTVVVGLLFFVWYQPLCGVINWLHNPHPAPTPPGGIGDLGFFGILFGTIIAGMGMSLLLWAATRSWKVLLALLAVSLVCGVLTLPTNGMASILWNIGFAAVLYAWACRRPLSWQDPAVCEHCGYSLYGLSAAVCPECGKPV